MLIYVYLLKIKCRINHVDSKKELCIQAADIIAGAIRNFYTFQNDKYYRYI
ncbi:MAG: DUF3800 domain-containing protein, partial [Candidatus Aenigmarchaeota archaeon]|nr:DUF3800 domain-containing protein [Candidatus Aenigmarchaeota archaeon]